MVVMLIVVCYGCHVYYSCDFVFVMVVCYGCLLFVMVVSYSCYCVVVVIVTFVSVMVVCYWSLLFANAMMLCYCRFLLIAAAGFLLMLLLSLW